MNIIFSEGSGLNDSVYGKCQAPIRMFLEKRGEAFEQQSALKDLFCMGKSENYGDLLTSMTAMNGFDPVGENGEYPADAMQEGFSKLLVYETWKDSFAVSAEMIEDGKMIDMKKRPVQFMAGYHRTRENFGAALYGAAIAGKTSVTFRKKAFDVTAADKLCLFHTAHTPKVSGAKQSNKFSNAFSVEMLDRAEAAMHQFKGDNNEILDVAPNTILIANDPDLKRQVFAAIGADKDPATANNGFNFQFGRWNVIIWNYLNQFITKGVKPWILLDSAYNEEYGGAVWNDRIPLSVKSIIDEKTDANVWQGRSRFNACFNDWRFACVGGIEGGTDLTTL